MKNLKTFSCPRQQVPCRCLVGFPPLYSPNLYFFSKLHLSLSFGTDSSREVQEGKKEGQLSRLPLRASSEKES